MAINGCSSCFVLTAVVGILFLPFSFYVPEVYIEPEETVGAENEPSELLPSFDKNQIPSLHLIATFALLSLGFFMYISEWIQRKIMERRIIKLNQYLSTNLEKLRSWDSYQEQLETTLKMVHNATTEYNLLLYLLLRQHNCIPRHKDPPSDCFFSKELEDFNFVPNPTVE